MSDHVGCGIVQRIVPLWQVILATVTLCVSIIGTVGTWAASASTRDALLAQHQMEQDRRIDQLEKGLADLAEIKAGMRVLLKGAR